MNKHDWLGVAAFVVIIVLGGAVLDDDIEQQCQVGLARCE